MTRHADPASRSGLVALSRSDLPVDATALARYLVGKLLVHDLEADHLASGSPTGARMRRGRRISGRIVETESYPVGDSTNHAFRGRRADNGSMFLAPGHAYVKLTYGVSYVINVSAETEGVGAGALIRALEPLEGLDFMRAQRPRSTPRDLARGPGRLALALGIGPQHDGVDLCTGRGLWLAASPADANAYGTVEPLRIGTTTRIGLAREMDRPLRFYVAGSPFVSGPRHLLLP